jgi:hypothetical protein
MKMQALCVLTGLMIGAALTPARTWAYTDCTKPHPQFACLTVVNHTTYSLHFSLGNRVDENAWVAPGESFEFVESAGRYVVNGHHGHHHADNGRSVDLVPTRHERSLRPPRRQTGVDRRTLHGCKR